MFSKKTPRGNTTIIGKGAQFTGTLVLDGPIVVEGHCEGSIRTNGELSVGPDGSVDGELVGNTVAIAGRVQGTLVAKEALVVLSSGHVEGEVYYGKLKVDTGGIIDGISHQGSRSEARVDPGLAADEESGVVRAPERSVSAFPAAGGARAVRASARP